MLLDVRHIFTAPYFPLSQFLIPVLTRYKAVFFWYLTQKHHLDQFRLSHPDTLPYRPGVKNRLMFQDVTG